MYRKSLITLLGLATFGMFGCSGTQPSFDASQTVVQVVKGKSYRIPVGAVTSPYVDDKVISFYQKIGLSDCKKGDITWEESNAKDEMSVAIGKGDKSVYAKLAKEKRIGCASAIR